MVATAKTIHEPAQSIPNDISLASLAVLMRAAGQTQKDAAELELRPRLGDEGWEGLEAWIGEHLDVHEALQIEALHPRMQALLTDTMAELPDLAAKHHYRDTYDPIADNGDGWCSVAHIDLVAPYVYRAMVWHAIWCLAKADRPFERIVLVIAGLSSEWPTEAEPEQQVVPTENAWKLKLREHYRTWVIGWMFAADLYDGFREKIRWKLKSRRWAMAADRAALAARVAADKIAATRRQSSASQNNPASSTSPAPCSPAPSRAQAPVLNGRALRGSVLGTWLALVGFSWISLLWGALISTPVGVGFMIFGTIYVSAMTVPLWATLWGFGGMGAARFSTLTMLEFQKADSDSRLAKATERLARSLDLPMPKVGVIPYANAFAMGTSTSDAVVAIGRPFLDKLPMSQVEAIIGHELGHVVSGDMRRMMLMRTFQNATVFYAVFAGFKHFMRHVICWAAEFYILAFSRRREFWADAIGAALTSKEAMIGALRSLESMPSVSRQERIHARFMFRGPWRAVYKTHPETSARIRALEEETYMRRLPFLRD